MPVHTTGPSESAPRTTPTVYLLLDDFGAFGRAYRETDERKADRDSIIADLLSGQYERPLRIIAFDTAAGWSRDVTFEIAREVSERTRVDEEPAAGLLDFLDRALGSRDSCERSGIGPDRIHALGSRERDARLPAEGSEAR